MVSSMLLCSQPSALQHRSGSAAMELQEGHCYETQSRERPQVTTSCGALPDPKCTRTHHSPGLQARREPSPVQGMQCCIPAMSHRIPAARTLLRAVPHVQQCQPWPFS